MALRKTLLPTYYYLMCIAVNVPGKNTAASKIQLTSKEMSICAAFWSISFDLVKHKRHSKPQAKNLFFFLTQKYSGVLFSNTSPCLLTSYLIYINYE